LRHPIGEGDGDEARTTGAGQNIDSESWEFALKLYAESGVADACLRLQDECSVDVMILLMATFAAARRGIVLGPSDIAQMDAACLAWREQIVLPLRALRTTLKSGPAPAPNERTERLRSSIKAAELSAERLQNELLAQWLAKREPVSHAIERAELIAVLHSVADFASRKYRSEQISARLPMIETIVDAALRVCE
jgi:uncharacterized protein (TIGR02444 family)